MIPAIPNLNSLPGYAIFAMEYLNPSLHFAESMDKDIKSIMGKYTKSSATVKGRDISNLVMHTLEPIKYLFVLSVVITAASFLAVKYTPIFSSIFKVIVVFSAVVTFDMYVMHSRIKDEYNFYKRQSKNTITFDDFRDSMADCGNDIYAHTFLISFSWILKDDLTEGIYELIESASDKSLTPRKVKQLLPGFYEMFRRIPERQTQGTSTRN
ncbi:MAG: hypothetical protein K1060chlam2_01105 [Chlamydiae bacterium]|nr:hypothetical protein [Chlamydiota bacterium]